jgi:hypothetical protein
MTWLWNTLMGWIAGFIAWLLNPVAWLEAALRVLAYIMELVATLLPESVAATVLAWSSYMASADLQALAGSVLFLFSPVVNPEVLLACIGLGLVVWILALCLKSITWIITRLYMGGN